MGVKLDAFIKLFDEKSSNEITKQQDRVSKKESQVEEFINLRNAAIKAATEFGVEGDAKIVADTFPENGMFNNEMFRNYLDTLFNGAFEEECRALFKRRNAPIQLQGAKQSLNRYTLLKEEGGESWFNKYMKAVGSAMAEAMSMGVYKDSDKLFREFFPDEYDEDNQDDIAMALEYDAYPDPPRGVMSSIELYEAAKEKGNPLKNTIEDTVEDTPVEEETAPAVDDTPIEEKVADIINEDTIEQEEEKKKEEEEFGPIETPINETEEKPKADLSKIIEPSINTEEATPRKLIKFGSKGKDVEFLQMSLGIEADGKFGPQTKKAVQDFQKANGLDPDGIVGPKTWAALNKIETVGTASKIEATAPELQPIESPILETPIEDTGESAGGDAATSVINEGDTNITNISGDAPIEAGDTSIFETINTMTDSQVEGVGGGGEVDITASTPIVSAIESIEAPDSPSLLGKDITSAINSSNIFSNISNQTDIFKGGSMTSLTSPGIIENISNISSSINEGASSFMSGAISNITNNDSNIEESFVSGGTSSIVDSIKNTDSITNNSAIEVNKEVNTLDKSFAPLVSSNQGSNVVNNQSSSESSSETSTITETSNINSPTTNLDSSSTTNNNTSSTENSQSSSMSNSFNTSALETRLRRIENLLLGPLDVKIVES